MACLSWSTGFWGSVSMKENQTPHAQQKTFDIFHAWGGDAMSLVVVSQRSTRCTQSQTNKPVQRGIFRPDLHRLRVKHLRLGKVLPGKLGPDATHPNTQNGQTRALFRDFFAYTKRPVKLSSWLTRTTHKKRQHAYAYVTMKRVSLVTNLVK